MQNNKQMMVVWGLLAAILILLGIAAGVGVSGYLMTGTEPAAVAQNNGAEAGEAGNTAVANSQTDAALPVPPTVNIPPTETATPSITPTPSHTPTATNTPEATATPTLTPTATPTETPTPSPTPTREGPIAEAVGEAGFFAGPGTSFGRRNYFARPGEIIVVLGQDETGEWWHVVSNANSYEGWVASRFFEVQSGDPASVALSDFEAEPFATAVAGTGGNAEATRPSGPPPQISTEAYWNFVADSSRAEQDEEGLGTGTWSGEILVRVPTGFTYEFTYGPVVDKVNRMTENQDGYDTYQLLLSGMGCGPFVTDLVVLQNGAQMVVKNEFTRKAGPVFIQFDC